jgi:glycogen debranching enzyme
LLTAHRPEYYSAVFFLRNPVAGGLEQDELSLVRERFVGEGMQDRLVVQSHARRPLSLELALEVGNDFADIFAAKHFDFALGDPLRADPLPDLVEPEFRGGENRFLFVDRDGYPGSTQVILSEPAEVDGGVARYRLELGRGERWELRVDVLPSGDGVHAPPPAAARRLGHERERVREALEAWNLTVPRLEASCEDLARTYRRSVSDLASLRMHGGTNGARGNLFAAGMPWFMTVFGRDTLITSLQTLLFGPELARNALVALGELQAAEDDPATDAEPGKIVHELRRGKGARAWLPRYYGTVDATPLYLILLSEVWRWTADEDLAAGLREPALRALAWIDEHGDLDGDGFVEYRRRAPIGADNHSWKDSGDSQLFADGSQAEPPIAPCEVQGYVYDAKLRLAELAREAWLDEALAARLDREAAELAERFDEAFWCEERGGYYALALDAQKRRVDALSSNVGHLLWSGIVPPERAGAVADRLMGEELWSGWGVRTMSTADAGYTPLGYHNGTVWPHDNSLIAWGLVRYGRWPEAQRIARRMLEAAGHFDHQLPEVFAGFARGASIFPIAYPTAARPQAWAAGTPVLLLQLLLGLRPDRACRTLVSDAPAELPAWLGDVALRGVRAFGRSFDVRASGGTVTVEPAY